MCLGLLDNVSESIGCIASEGRSLEERQQLPSGSSAVSSCPVLSEALRGSVFWEVTPGSQVFVEGQMALVSLPALS